MSYTKTPFWIIGRRSPEHGLEVVYNTMGNTAQDSWKCLSPAMADAMQSNGFRAHKVQATTVLRTMDRAEAKRAKHETCNHEWRPRSKTLAKYGDTHVCKKCLATANIGETEASPVQEC